MARAVIFDCDGCLVDSEAIVHEILIEMMTGVELVYDAGRFMGMDDREFFGVLNTDHQTLHGRPLPQNFRDRFMQRAEAAHRERLTEVTGAAAAVGLCPVPKAVASGSSTAVLQAKLQKVGLWDVFEPHIYSAQLVSRGKPAPDVFLYAARALNVDPAHCLVIEDSTNGVRAGVAAGMTVWGFMGGGHIVGGDADRLRAAGASRIVGSWEEAGRAFGAWG